MRALVEATEGDGRALRAENRTRLTSEESVSRRRSDEDNPVGFLIVRRCPVALVRSAAARPLKNRERETTALLTATIWRSGRALAADRRPKRPLAPPDAVNFQAPIDLSLRHCSGYTSLRNRTNERSNRNSLSARAPSGFRAACDISGWGGSS